MTQVKIDTKGFDILKDSLQKNIKTRVGILGEDASKKEEGSNYTLSEIGAVHEFGSIKRNIPKRSFLKMPLELKVFDWVKENAWKYKELLEKNKVENWYDSLGLIAQTIIQRAFTTRGFGKWAPNSEKTIKMKGSDMPLINTSTMRRSISYKVLKNANERKK